MASFSDSQIEDAKRRVNEMRAKAREYTDDGIDNKAEHISTHNSSSFSSNKSNASASLPFGIDGIFKSLGIGNNDEDSKGSGLILALILVLSYEKADNMLILALLYILL